MDNLTNLNKSGIFNTFQLFLGFFLILSCDSPTDSEESSGKQREIPDTTKPELNLLGSEYTRLCKGEEYKELSATANDNCCGNLTEEIIIDTSQLNTDSTGTYSIIYTVTDSSGNSDSAVRTVEVIECPDFSSWDTSFTLNSIQFPDSSILENSIVKNGTGERLNLFFSKFDKENEINIGYIGGSITAGAKAEETRLRYTNRLCSFLKKVHPKIEFNVINAGIGGTTSRFGCSRADDDLINVQPDMIIIEFAVNDPLLLKTKISVLETMEGLIRKSMYNDSIPVILFYTMSKNGNTQCHEAFNTLADHYGIPVISYHHAMFSFIQEEKISWSDLSPDNIHPNNTGHLICAYLLYSFLKNRYMELDTLYTPLPDIPEPYSTDLYENSGIMKAQDQRISVVSNSGCEAIIRSNGRIGYQLNSPDDSIVLETDCREVTIGYTHSAQPEGCIKVTTDKTIQDTVFSNSDGNDFEYMEYYQVFKKSVDSLTRFSIKSCDTLPFEIQYIMYAK